MHLRLTIPAALAALTAAVSATTTGSSTTKTTNTQNTIVAPRTAGCGKSHFWKGFSGLHNIHSSDRTRYYELNLPHDYDKDKAYPIVFGFHGSSSIGTFFELDTRLSERRNSGERIMVYPFGVGGFWAGASYSKVPIAEDLRFINDLLAELRSDYCVDDSRIYATGLSNGGGFVNLLACDPVLSAEFAAFAPASGSYYAPPPEEGRECKPARTPMPMISIHGGSDTSVPYKGGQGEGGMLPSIDDWLSEWAKRNGCEGKEQPVHHTDQGNVHFRSWKGCGNDTDDSVLEHWKEDTMGHCWAAKVINLSQTAALNGPTFLDANDLIMNFFNRHPKPL